MYNKTIIRFGFCDIQNNQGQGLSGVYITLFLDEDLVKMALPARKACRAFEKRAPGRGPCVVFLSKALYSHSASLHPDL